MKKNNIIYDISFNWILKIRGVMASVLCVVLMSLMFTSCDEDPEIEISLGSPIECAVSKSEVVLNQKFANATAVDFTWTPGSNQGTGAAISYILQLDVAGNGFANAKSVQVGKGVFSKKYSHGQINDLIVNEWGLSSQSPVQIESRTIAVVSSESVKSDTSNVVVVEAVPYEPVSSTLFMVGAATPNGWDNTNATALQADANDATTFIYEGLLKAGELKFITQQGQWLPSYQKGTDDQHLVLRTDDSQPDEKFVIAESGIYTITLNLLDLTITIEKMDQTPYNELWIVGDATPNGWNIDNPNKMLQDPSDSFIFSFNGMLNAGDFKIPTSIGDFGCDYYMPLTNNPDISETTVQLVTGGDPDNKWHISEAGPYKIQLNLRDLTIAITPFVPYTKLWIVGDATPTGWNIDNPTEMIADPSDPNVFTYSGDLTVGEFKIPTATGDWGTDFFMPAINHPELTDTRMKFIPKGAPDNKWQITVAGNYTITINQLYETCSIVKN